MNLLQARLEIDKSTIIGALLFSCSLMTLPIVLLLVSGVICKILIVLLLNSMAYSLWLGGWMEVPDALFFNPSSRKILFYLSLFIMGIMLGLSTSVN